MSSKRLTLRDIAKRAGVSTSTVSRVINGVPSVSPELRETVNKLARELDYEKRARRPFGRKRSTSLVGLIVPDISNPYFALLVQGIEIATKQYHLNLLLCDSENDGQTETEIVGRLAQLGVMGLIIVPTGGDGQALARAIADNEIPFVYLDRTPGGSLPLNSVTADNRAGAYQAVKYLMALGHRDILYLAGYAQSSTDHQRRAGYEMALNEQSVRLDVRLRISGDYSWDRAHEAVRALADGDAQFSAIFAANDLMALGAIQALQERGMRVPDDVSIVGYDDIPFSKLISLTTVAQHPEDMAGRAVRLLIDIIEKRITPQKAAVLMPSLILRGSCRRK